MTAGKRGSGRTALVTGASGGIGEQLTRLLAADGFNLVLVSRSAHKMKTLAARLESEHGLPIRICAMDLAQPGATTRLWTALTESGVIIDVLVNNAGSGVYGEVWEQDADALRQMLVLNVEALTLLTRYALPGMLERRWGRILNLGSVVAYQPGGPRMAAYYASKSYVLSFSKGLAVELRGTGVTVTALCPGLTRTEFMEHAGATHSILDKTPASRPAHVARDGYRGLMRGRSVVIPGVLTKVFAVAGELPPRRIALAVNDYLTRPA